MKYYLAPSILAADFNHLGSQIETVEAAGAQWLHIDVMDGMFVPNFSVGVPVVESIRKTSGLFFDVHLMIESPIRYIRQFAEAGADSITFHIEAVNDPIRVIEEIRAMDRRVGVSVKPRTPLSMIEPILDQVDMVLVMTVEPGFGGKAFKPEDVPDLTDDEIREKLLDNYYVKAMVGQSHPLPFGKALHYLHGGLIHVSHIEPDRTLNTVEVIVDSAVRLDEKR